MFVRTPHEVFILRYAFPSIFFTDVSERDGKGNQFPCSLFIVILA